MSKRAATDALLRHELTPVDGLPKEVLVTLCLHVLASALPHCPENLM
jgi:hypothetical protein